MNTTIVGLGQPVAKERDTTNPHFTWVSILVEKPTRDKLLLCGFSKSPLSYEVNAET